MTIISRLATLSLTIALPLHADEKPRHLPLLTPAEALSKFQIEPGFQIEILASEPLVHTPVAAAYAADGSLWVAEMASYMPDPNGTGENAPVNRITVLTDSDGDGRMDTSTPFLDGLVLPRLVAFAYGGLVYSSPPELWHVEILPGNKPGKRSLIDAGYARGGNVEHQPNAFLRNLDNWFYNAKSDTRYRRINGRWVKQKTAFRGQWGLTRDAFGRLYYNTNSTGLLNDQTPPGLLNGHPHKLTKSATGNRTVKSNAVEPAHPTGVNRGYKPGTLDAGGKLASYTAACGPLIYLGNALPSHAQNNAFVCEPSANLITRNTLDFSDPLNISGTRSDRKSEFLTSTDERFRPVNIINAPDGTMTVIDMHRGIIQHKTYLTPYLRDYLVARDLHHEIHPGRLYRIAPTGYTPTTTPDLADSSTADLCHALAHDNAWHRDTAQRLLIDRADASAIPSLNKLAALQRSPLGQIHALWTLEGLGFLSPGAIIPALGSNDPRVQATAAHLAGQAPGPSLLKPLGDLARSTSSPLVRIHIATALGRFRAAEQEPALELLATLLADHPGDPYIKDAAISGLHGAESAFAAVLGRPAKKTAKELLAVLGDLATKTASNTIVDNTAPPAHLAAPHHLSYTRGRVHYQTHCMGCHQQDGAGLATIAPPIDGSEWVSGPAGRLAKILLQGLSGPITVAGKTYTVPEIQPIMPGLKYNPLFDDSAIADVMTYIRNTWSNNAAPVLPTTVTTARKAIPNTPEPYEAKSLQ
ncbi:MAG: HEAT repeat domain-containing protein [Verrucomicrobiales bacterium]|nr:HEAT repeat domain-containing protein [Verrucomicrobiales bacterium]